jgi:hypothetical protein
VDDRRKWAVFAVLLGVLALGVGVVALAGGEDSGDGGRLTVERSFVPGTKQPELLVSVQRKLNVPDTADNGRTVGLICTDGEGRKVMEIARIAECRVTGTSVALRGRMRLRTD